MNRREKQILEGAAAWCSFYRENISIFIEDYLHVRLKIFQKILVEWMNRSTVAICIGARGIGKTYLSALFCVARAILYPGTKIVVASGVRSQGIGILEKILLELKPNSKELAAEIDDKLTRINGTNAQICFRNGSYIKVVTAGDSARGNRANILVIDEARLVSKDVVDTILRKFLTQRRMPMYSALTDAEKEVQYSKEKNMTMYLTSAYFSDSWMYQKCIDTCKYMLDDTKRQFVCGLPYQLSIAEGLLDKETVEDELGDTDFSETKFSMEFSALWFGAGEDSFFDFDVISKNRHIKYPMLPDKLAVLLNNSANVKIPSKTLGEKRILSADIALMSSRKRDNDATAIFINRMLPTKAGRYSNNIVYASSDEGLRTEEQALRIRKMFDEYDCDYLVLDAAGIGMGVADALMRDMVDPETGEIYPALSCCNDSEMASRCTVPGAPKVIWSIKANAQFNSDVAIGLREGLRSGRIRLLENEYDGENLLSEIKGYNSLTPQQKIQLQLPYINTTLLIEELVKLDHEETNGRIKLRERSGMRKDRYSSLAYNFWVASQIESKIKKKQGFAADGERQYIIRAPKHGRGRLAKGGRGETWARMSKF